MSDFIPLAVPHLGGRESEYIQECIDTNWVSYVGSFVSRFERDLAERTGAEEAVAVTSGTAALHIGLEMVGVEPDTEVVMPGISFVAPANAVRYCGAWPAFVDIREDDWQMDVGAVADFLENECERRGAEVWNRNTGRRVSAVLIVHILGGLGASEDLLSLCEEFGLPLVEDVAECLGSSRGGKSLCQSRSSNVPHVWGTSFNGNKIVTTGGGGALLCNEAGMASRARHLTTTAKTDALTFFHDRLGYNLRLTNVAAAMGVAQLERLDFHVAEKRRIAAGYKEAFAGDARIFPNPEPEGCDSNFWLYTILLDRDALPVVEKLNKMGVGCRPIWHPLSDLPYLTESYCHGLPFGSELHRRALSLPCSVGLSADHQNRVVDTLNQCLDS